MKMNFINASVMIFFVMGATACLERSEQNIAKNNAEAPQYVENFDETTVAKFISGDEPTGNPNDPNCLDRVAKYNGSNAAPQKGTCKPFRVF